MYCPNFPVGMIALIFFVGFALGIIFEILVDECVNKNDKEDIDKCDEI